MHKAMRMDGSERPQSQHAYAKARRSLPDGVSRVTLASAEPIYVASGEGAYVVDVDGNRYLDFHNNFTTLIHGHAFPPVVEAICAAARKGTCFGNPTGAESKLAELIIGRVRGIDQIRFVNTGTEAVMFAIKAARAFTGRPAIAKFEGAFHGSYDWAEVSEASTPENWGGPFPASTPPYNGTPVSVLEEVVVLPFNDLAATQELLNRHSDRLAAVLIDLMPSRLGMIEIDRTYLRFLRDFTASRGILLIDDEVLNFRQTFNGAASRFGLEPDLTTFGKIIGGGLPIGAVAGAREIMSVFAIESGPLVPQGGTFSANPLSIAAGIASMTHLTQAKMGELNYAGTLLRESLDALFRSRNWPLSTTGFGSLMRIHPKATPPANYRETWPDPSQKSLLNIVHDHLLRAGIIFKGPATLSTAMSPADHEYLLDAFRTLPI